MTNWKRIALFTLVLAGLGGTAAVTLAPEPAAAAWTCDECYDRYITCSEGCEAHPTPTCQSSCNRSYTNCTRYCI